MHLLARKKRLIDKHKDLDVMPKVNKADMVKMMGSIEEYLRSCHDVKRALLA